MNSKKDLVEHSPFEKGSQFDILHSAITNCAIEGTGNNEPYVIYEWLEKTPKTSLVVHIVEKLNEMGYKIIAND